LSPEKAKREEKRSETPKSSVLRVCQMEKSLAWRAPRRREL